MDALTVLAFISCYGTARGLRVSQAMQAWTPHVPDERPTSSRPSQRPQQFARTGRLSSTSSGSGDSGSAAPKGFGSRASRRSKAGVKRRKPGDVDSGAPPVVVLKRSSRWACVKGCGACCYLAPDERPDLAEYLPDPEELDLYKSMAMDDGWCKHFDRESRACTIYEDRPRFCRVETETFGDMYGVEPEDMDDFCSSCCREQIGDVYGAKSKEMRAFKAALEALERGERPTPELTAFGGDIKDGGGQQIRDWGLGEDVAESGQR